MANHANNTWTEELGLKCVGAWSLGCVYNLGLEVNNEDHNSRRVVNFDHNTVLNAHVLNAYARMKTAKSF